MCGATTLVVYCYPLQSVGVLELNSANEVTAVTLKRHGYYCRSRKHGEPAARARACVACAKAKARCDNVPLTCGRCASKRLSCVYRSPQAASRQTPEYLHGKPGYAEETRSLSRTSTAMHAAQSSASLDDINLGSRHTLSATDVPLDKDSSFHWDLIDFSSPKQQDWFYRDPLEPMDLTSHELASIETQHLHDPVETYKTMDLTISTMPTFEMRCFPQRAAIKGSANATATMMTRILTSYPSMMCKQQSPPPFIYSSSLKDSTHQPMDESLATCTSLMHLLSTNTTASHRLVWKNMHLECERLHAQVNHFPNLKFLS